MIILTDSQADKYLLYSKFLGKKLACYNCRHYNGGYKGGHIFCDKVNIRERLAKLLKHKSIIDPICSEWR